MAPFLREQEKKTQAGPKNRVRADANADSIQLIGVDWDTRGEMGHRIACWQRLMSMR